MRHFVHCPHEDYVIFNERLKFTIYSFRFSHDSTKYNEYRLISIRALLQIFELRANYNMQRAVDHNFKNCSLNSNTRQRLVGHTFCLAL